MIPILEPSNIFVSNVVDELQQTLTFDFLAKMLETNLLEL